ncbi:MAG: hypothetical protein ACFFDY_13065 [Candidatus Thorarchaeota archaeon]
MATAEENLVHTLRNHNLSNEVEEKPNNPQTKKKIKGSPELPPISRYESIGKKYLYLFKSYLPKNQLNLIFQ